MKEGGEPPTPSDRRYGPRTSAGDEEGRVEGEDWEGGEVAMNGTDAASAKEA